MRRWLTVGASRRSAGEARRLKTKRATRMTRPQPTQIWGRDGALKKWRSSLIVSWNKPSGKLLITINSNFTIGFQEFGPEHERILAHLHHDEFSHRTLTHVASFYEQVSAISSARQHQITLNSLFPSTNLFQLAKIWRFPSQKLQLLASTEPMRQVLAPEGRVAWPRSFAIFSFCTRA